MKNFDLDYLCQLEFVSCGFRSRVIHQYLGVLSLSVECSVSVVWDMTEVCFGNDFSEKDFSEKDLDHRYFQLFQRCWCLWLVMTYS